MTGRVVCENCRGTGQADKVDRGPFAPGNCEPCGTTGWVDPETGRREPTMTRPDSPESVPADLEAAAKWHERQADSAMGSLHCGSENWEYRAARKEADMHAIAARSIRAIMQDRSDCSARTARSDVESAANASEVIDAIVGLLDEWGKHQLARALRHSLAALPHPYPTEPEAEQRIREDRASREAERNRLFDLYERDPEQFAAVVAEDRARLRDGEWS